MRSQISFAVAATMVAFGGSSALAADLPEPISVGPAPVAPALISEFILEGWGGVAFLAGESGNVDADNDTLGDFGGSARFGFPLSQSISAQLDVYGEITTNGGDTDNFDDSLIGAAHLNWRDPTTGLFGLFGGGGFATAEDDDSNLWFIGLEGQYYSGNWTFYGQGGYFDTDNDNAFKNAFFARGVTRYFLSPDSRFQGELSFAVGEQDTDDQDATAIGWGLRYDQGLGGMFPSLPATGFLGYRGGYFKSIDDNANDDGVFTDHTIYAGLRFTFGGGGVDLMTSDRAGATLDIPDVGRWVSSGEILD